MFSYKCPVFIVDARDICQGNLDILEEGLLVFVDGVNIVAFDDSAPKIRPINSFEDGISSKQTIFFLLYEVSFLLITFMFN
jgi:hypothetical protein